MKKQYITQEELIAKLKAGVTLTRLKSFVKPGASLNLNTSVSRKDYFYYTMSDGSDVHHLTIKSMISKGLMKIDTSSAERTIGGTKANLVLV